MREWITRGELNELREHERRRERRADFRLAAIVGVSLLFWVVFFAWMCSGRGTP